jgi:sigma-54 dependent transcriptional regulator, acetoin dehydrogenase operon transcriptional activator AcoR
MLSRPTADLRLWERFQSGDCSDHEVQSSVVLQRWSRCRRAGLSADNPGEAVMALAGLAEAVDSFAPLLATGAPFDAFASTMANAGFCGLFCDSSGVILSRRIAEPFAKKIAETRLEEGAVWSEPTRGTNGLGTTLVEKTAVAVVGAEHYELRNHGLACYAAPIRDIRERVVAVLDATGPVSAASGFIHASVIATAAAIEALIVARTYDAAVPGGLFELERLLAQLPHPTVLIESTRRVRRVNARFRRMFATVSEQELAQLVSSQFSGPRHGAEARIDLPNAMRGLAAEFEPLGDPSDPFAAIVHLRPRRARRAVPAAGDSRTAAFASIVGSDTAIAAARSQAARFADTDLPVLLLAETGAGKELFARGIHAGGARASGPFIAVNCGALTGSLLESELFGYGPGAFTGAAPAGRTGKLAAAHGGTLFLDEIGEMTLPAQAMLLRFLEDGTYYRVGEATERHADVRLVAATSRDLPALVSETRFRSDLYFRIRGVVLRLPAVRDRTDIRELAAVLLERIARTRRLPKPLGLSPAALDWIERNDWPGNVRELLTALEYAVVLAGDAPRVEVWHLPIEQSSRAPVEGDLRVAAERTALLQALDRARGNLSDAARTLGVARSTLYRMLGRHGLRQGAEEREEATE